MADFNKVSFLEWVEWVSQRAKETQLPDAPRTPSERRVNGVKQRQRVKRYLTIPT